MQAVLRKTVLFLLVLAFPVSAETIRIYTYHVHPPFVTGQDTGLTYDLAEALTAASQGQHTFVVELVPRKRMNMMIQGWIQGRCPGERCRTDWIVPWVNPKWGFIQGGSDPYLWVEQFEDANSIITRASDDIQYLEPATLNGKVFAGIRGHKYLGIDELVASGDIKRVDGDRERDNIVKLLHKRVDAALLPDSTLNYYFTQDQELKQRASEVRVSDVKQQKYTRYVMLPGGRDDLKALVDQYIAGTPR